MAFKNCQIRQKYHAFLCSFIDSISTIFLSHRVKYFQALGLCRLYRVNEDVQEPV